MTLKQRPQKNLPGSSPTIREAVIEEGGGIH
jgi:hypothetical protein